MPSKARLKFKANADDVARLLEIHSDLGGDRKGRRFRLEVLNKSAIVLITAIWEAYCEDLASEAVKHIVKHAPDSTSLPKELKKRIAKELKDDLNEISIWALADPGWRVVLTQRLSSLAKERNRKLNTPKAENIIDLFSVSLGLLDLTDRWCWPGMSAPQAKAKLNQYVALRGAIAHRGSAAKSCTKKDVEDYFAHIKRLVGKTGGKVNRHVKGITGVFLWTT
jgi:RiboL-PSP-HEPN